MPAWSGRESLAALLIPQLVEVVVDGEPGDLQRLSHHLHTLLEHEEATVLEVFDHGDLVPLLHEVDGRPAGVDRLSEQVLSELVYTSDAADEEDSVDLGGRRIIKKKKH